MATVPPPPSSGPAWLGEYTPPPKPTKTEKLPPRSQRRSRERRQSSARLPVPLERRESVGGINVWAPPRAAVQEPEVNPESDSTPVKPAVNETESHTPNTMSAPEENRMLVETAYASADHTTPQFDNRQANGDIIPPLAHQEGMELPTGAHHLNESIQQSPPVESILPTMEPIDAAEVDSASLLSPDVSRVQVMEWSSLQEEQHHTQQQSRPSHELERQSATFTSQPGEFKSKDYHWQQQEHAELKTEFDAYTATYQQDTSQEYHGHKVSVSIDTDKLDEWYTISPRKSGMLLHRKSCYSPECSPPGRQNSPLRNSSLRTAALSPTSHLKSVMQSIKGSMEELPDVKITEDSGCPQCGSFWSVELGSLYSLLRGVYKDMVTLQQAQAKNNEALLQENEALRNDLKETIGHAKLLQYELSETASTLQAERSLAKSQNLWLEKMGEKDVANSLDTSNLCELVEEQAQEILAAQSTMNELCGLLETKLSETPMKQENDEMVQPKMAAAEGSLHSQDC